MFRAELRLPTISYIGKGEGRAIKLAQTEAARDMCRFMLSQGLISALDLTQVRPSASFLLAPLDV